MQYRVLTKKNKLMKLKTIITGTITLSLTSDSAVVITNDEHGFYVYGKTHGLTIDTRANGPALSTLDKALRHARAVLNPYKLG